MKKINILLVMTMVLGLLNGCACQNIEQNVTPTETITSTDNVTEVDVVTETEEDIEEIINSKYDHLSEVRRKNLLFVVTNTDFDLDEAVVITCNFDQIGIGELAECVLVKETTYGEHGVTYVVKIADISGKVYYYVLSESWKGHGIGLDYVFEDSLDGKLIYHGDWGYNPDGWEYEEGLIVI